MGDGTAVTGDGKNSISEASLRSPLASRAHWSDIIGWATDQKTVTYIWDIKDLSRPVLTGRYKSPIVAVDHNLYMHPGLESNYKSGLRIVDVSSVADDPTGADFFEAAFFDAHPEEDAVGGEPSFGGVWSTYPHFESGYILVNTLERGLFVDGLKTRDERFHTSL
ncbi:hypothetical protein DFH09DRAFT_1336521 [Mycena vulgaris]|nr:hypothetical protein DFH09DRAFT_1336521 [Mycena vulgaris]